MFIQTASRILASVNQTNLQSQNNIFLHRYSAFLSMLYAICHKKIVSKSNNVGYLYLIVFPYAFSSHLLDIMETSYLIDSIDTFLQYHMTIL